MAKNLSSKKPLSVNKRSHALNTTKSKQRPNLQTVTVDGIKVKLSAREARTFKKSDNTTETIVPEVNEATTVAE